MTRLPQIGVACVTGEVSVNPNPSTSFPLLPLQISPAPLLAMKRIHLCML